MELLERAFQKMGARVKFDEAVVRRIGGRWAWRSLALDVREDSKGEFFLISRDRKAIEELVVLDVQPRDRHLLLLSRENGRKHRFLLGHDERHWFVAGIPETTPVSRVADAKLALKPEAVLAREETEYGQMSEGERSRWSWRMMRRNPTVYARGRVRHPDHATVTLDGWHDVFSNTEHLSDAMRDVVFLD